MTQPISTKNSNPNKTTVSATANIKIPTLNPNTTIDQVAAVIEKVNPKVEEQRFQHYRSARPAMKMITEEGKKIVFTGFELVTKDKDIISYLDLQIKLRGSRLGIIKGELLTADEANPAEALRRKHIEEYKKEEAKKASDKALGITRDMGQTKDVNAAAINPLSSNNIAN